MAPCCVNGKASKKKRSSPGFVVGHSANMSFGLWDIDAGASLPEHAHPHEQVGHLLEGEFSLTIAGVAYVMKTGSVAVIPSNARHSGKAVTACRILDVFYPLREDYFPDGLRKFLQDTNNVKGVISLNEI
jgi:quercetin dioxygenase-like cupin family protein